MFEIAPDQPGDQAGIDALLDAAFGPGRFALTAWRLREGVDCAPGLSFVARDAGSAMVGTIRFWPVRIGGAPALLLGPLAVDPARRGEGAGIGLMEHGLKEAAGQGHACVILVGDAPYYARVGFAPVPPGRMIMPGPVDPARLLARALVPGALDRISGTVKKCYSGQT